MKTKRTLPYLLAVTALLGLLASSCIIDPYYRRHHRRHGGHRSANVEHTIDAPLSTEAAAR